MTGVAATDSRFEAFEGDRDYIFFALQIDYSGKLNPAIDITAFYDRWELNDRGIFKALRDLRKKGIVVYYL